MTSRKKNNMSTPQGRKLVQVQKEEVPSEVLRTGGKGRSRIPTEFDDVMPELYDAGFQKIELQEGDDPVVLMKQIRKAAALHNYGVFARHSDPENAVYFSVQKKLKRGPQKNRQVEDVSNDSNVDADFSDLDETA